MTRRLASPERADAILQAHKHGRGMVQRLTDYTAADPETRRPNLPCAAGAYEVTLVMERGKVWPAIVLRDGSTVVLSLHQMRAMAEAFRAFDGIFVGTPSTSVAPNVPLPFATIEDVPRE